MPEVDYSALAEQARKSTPIDYSALAAQARDGAREPDTKSGIVLTGAGEVIPASATLARTFANSPNVPQIASKIGRVIGGIAPVIGGAEAGGVTGALAGVAAASKGAWAGGRTGWFTGKLLQKLASPVAGTLEAVAPYAQTLSTLGSIANVGSLAQMAEPGRKDIGFLGVGASMPDLQVLTTAVEKGANPAQAAAQIANGDPKRFGALMTAYMQSRQVK